MRTLALSLILLLATVAVAQSSARHGATVDIPPTLKLRLDGLVSLGSAEQPLRIDLADGEAVVRHGDLEILANVSWQLSVAYLPGCADDEFDLRARAFAGGWVDLARVERTIASGGPTGGWRASRLEIDLVGDALGDGSYRGTLITTLAQP